MNKYSSTVQYVGSGLKYLKNMIDLDSIKEDNDYKIPEGIKTVFITSLASIIEGVIKSYLKSEVRAISINKEIIEKSLFQEKPEDNNTEPVVSFQRTIGELKNNKAKNDELINKIIEVELNKIESLTWEKLKQEFNKISNEDLKTLLNNHQPELAGNIEAIFKFRNLFLHGNVIEFKNKESGGFEFQGRAKFLSDFIKKYNLEKEDIKSEDHFIELLVTKKTMDFFFDKIYNEFLRLPKWNESPETRNMINLIWKK